MADQVTLLDLNFGTSEAEKGLDALIAKSIALAKTKKIYKRLILRKIGA